MIKNRSKESLERKRQYTKEWWARQPHERLLIYSARQRAKRDGLEFDIDETDLVVPKLCPILGIELVKSKEKQTNSSPSIDRIDTTKGYVKGNVRIISYKANACKNNLTPQQIEALYKYVFELD